MHAEESNIEIVFDILPIALFRGKWHLVESISFVQVLSSIVVKTSGRKSKYKSSIFKSKSISLQFGNTDFMLYPDTWSFYYPSTR